MRKKIIQWTFSVGTAANLMLLSHIHTDGILRADCNENYLEGFGVADLLVFIVLSAALYFLFGVVRRRLLPFWSRLVGNVRVNAFEKMLDKNFTIKIFGVIFICWFFFLLVFYPGSAMNDTVNICANPRLLMNQHPPLYVLYTYGFYRLGVLLGNPNIGLAVLSLFQIVCMDYVVTYAISLFRRRGASKSLCVLLALYFGIAPLFGTYAVSAIKDTPFGIAMFMLCVLLYEGADSKGDLFASPKYFIRIWLCVFVMAGFRSNGLIIAVGTCVFVLILYRNGRKTLFAVLGTSVAAAALLNSVLMPSDVEKLYQEKVGIPIQQVAAAVNKGSELTDAQKEYLYRLMPKEAWAIYAPSCSDNVKWSSQFDREYLNETKAEFIKIWLELMVENPRVYFEAYVLETYGVWGIETRNGEQYYEKKIYENDLGLYQDSPLPSVVEKLFYTYYCNRFTYRYLSEGTAFWVMFGMMLWLVYRRRYVEVCVFIPMAFNFVSLLAASPIAFAFRYVFALALMFPFMVLVPFVKNERRDDYAPVSVYNNSSI